MQLNFKNKCGRLTLLPVSGVQSVRCIRGKDIDDYHKFSIDIAEQVALITGNRGIQLCPCNTSTGLAFYIVIHETPSTGAVARISLLDYVGPDATQAVQDNRCTPHM